MDLTPASRKQMNEYIQNFDLQDSSRWKDDYYQQRADILSLIHISSLPKQYNKLHNEALSDVSNGFRGRRVCRGGKIFELRSTIKAKVPCFSSPAA